MPTIKEIAAVTGYSPSTVSVVLRGKGNERKILQSTQEKILTAARNLGYTPNISARRLRNIQFSKKLVLAVFWASDFRASMVVRFLRGLQREVAESKTDCEIIIRPYTNGTLSEAASLSEMNMFNAAIICNASAADIEFLEENEFPIPIILYNRVSEKYCTVNVDSTKLGGLAADVFLSHNKKAPAVITSEPVFSDMILRVESFYNAFEKQGITYRKTIYEENTMKGGYEAAKLIAESDSLPDCVFCASDALAIGALRAFSQCGIRIPDDIELISVGNGENDMQEYASTSLSVVHIPMEDMAAFCFRILIDVTNGKVQPPYSVVLPVKYIPRESCGDIPHN
ncbi:MAG: LacI family transcriptional regulator [Clostridiales bacterium]|nr:LacI family transcriptional regulator [Clostridiales bacterium]